MKQIDTNYANALRTAANEGVDKDARFELKLPEWYDDGKYKRAQTFYKTNLLPMLLMNICGAISILAVPSLLKVLMHTKKSSTNQTAYCRYVATVLYTTEFYENDLEPGSISWKSLKSVRRMHVAGSRSSQKAGCGIVSQKDMAITQFAFMGYGVLQPQFLGLKGDKTDMEAFIHFWRVIGYMLGIKDEYNLCTDTLETTKVRAQTVLQEFLMEILVNPTKDFYHMSKVIVDGLWSTEPTLRYESMMFYIRRLAGIRYFHYFDSEIENEPDKEDLKRKSEFARLDWYSRFIVAVQVNILEYWYHFSWVRWFFNKKTLFNDFMNKYFPILAIFQHGMQHAYVRIHK